MAATFFATFVIPMFYVLIAEKLRRKHEAPTHGDAPPGPERSP